ncbi:MAG: hypothetical protein IJ371_06165 [Clostridia bacterium]|nr:hypothetical protein [Clostridia bacterium]
MNKFIKGAIACAMVVPCVTGLVGCGEKVDKTEKAYEQVFSNVDNIASKLSSITADNVEFQLNINVSIDYKQIVEGIASADAGFAAKLRAVIGAKNNDSNKEVFGNLGMVDTQDNFTSLLSAYAKDDVDAIDGDSDEVFTSVKETVNAENWQYFKNLVYVKDINENYITAGDTYNAEETYYMLTQDLMHFYLNSNVDVLKEYTLLTSETAPEYWEYTYAGYYTKEGDEYVRVTGDVAPTYTANTYYEQTGIDINEILNEMELGFEIPNGKMYATLNVGMLPSEVPTTPEIDVPSTEGNMDIEAMLEQISSMDFETFKSTIDPEGVVKFSNKKYDNGDVSLIASAEGQKMEFIAKANGGIALIMDMDMVYDGYGSEVDVRIDIDLENEVDETYIPTDLASYGNDPADLEQIIAGLLG